MDGEDLYDEFGNYIGPDLEDLEDEGMLAGGQDLYRQEVEEEGDEQEHEQHTTQAQDQDDAVPVNNHQIVLHEDKKYYQSAQEIYGTDVEALIQEEDAQPLTQPIIAPVKENLKFEHEKNLPVTMYNKE